MLRTFRDVAVIASVAALVPATSYAATSGGNVGATVLDGELSVSVALNTPMVLSHATPATASSTVSVISTLPSWNLTVSDTSAANQGHLKQCAMPVGGDVLPTYTAAGDVLDNPLEISSDGGGAFASLGSSAHALGSGSLVGSKTVFWRQALGAAEDVPALRSYCTTLTYTVT